MVQNGLPVDQVLTFEEAHRINDLIQSGDLDQATRAVAGAIAKLTSLHRTEKQSAPDRVSVHLATPGPASERQVSTAGTGRDADNILWGTEVYPDSLADVARDTLKNIYPVRFLKVRFQATSFSTSDGKTFSPEVCLPTPSHCVTKYNLDVLAGMFRDRGWSMMPMITTVRGKPASTEDKETFINLVDWFISRYRSAADIRYLELVDAPAAHWKNTKEELADLQNRVYDRIKGKYPEVMVGTPGFEYFLDVKGDDISIRQIEYFLDKKNKVKFDFWAFHGYPTIDFDSFIVKRTFALYPPTKKGMENKYSGPAGILEIRKMLDANGWDDRLIIDTEHTNTPVKSSLSEDEYLLDAAYTVQELLVKRTLKSNKKSALSGMVPLKLGPRGDKGEFLYASLQPDGSATRTVRAVGLLLSKLKEFSYSSHVSGEFDNEDQVWMEKFQAGEKELYAFFKPFHFQKGQRAALDGKSLKYTLAFRAKPTKIVLTGLDNSVTNIAPSQTIVLDAVNAPQFLEASYE